MIISSLTTVIVTNSVKVNLVLDTHIVKFTEKWTLASSAYSLKLLQEVWSFKKVVVSGLSQKNLLLYHVFVFVIILFCPLVS